MKLIFVYNADSGFFSKVAGSLHKIISSKTYNCSLCAITHGHAGMKIEWNNFLKSLEEEPVFLYKDQFYKKYNNTAISTPAVF